MTIFTIGHIWKGKKKHKKPIGYMAPFAHHITSKTIYDICANEVKLKMPLKELLVFLSILLLAYTPLYASQETRVKVGYAEIACEPITAGPVLGLSYQARYKWLAVEPGLTFMTNRISQVGRMYVAEPSITLKAYINNLYLGVGVGYYFNCISEYFGNQSDLDDEINRFGVIGLEFPDMFIELKTCFSDLDLETGIPYETTIESHSRYDNFQILIGKRWKF